MKKSAVAVLVVVLFIAMAGFSHARLSPILQIMLARLGWIQSIVTELSMSNFEGLKNHADLLAADAQKAGETAPAGSPPQNFSYKLRDAARAMSDGASKKDGVIVVKQFGETLSACYVCHTMLRDK
jgi:hypothetical protein